MNRTLKIMSTLTGVFVILTILSGVFMVYMMQAGSGLGTVGVLVFTAVGIPTLICLFGTAGLWIFQRNRSVDERAATIQQETQRN